MVVTFYSCERSVIEPGSQKKNIMARAQIDGYSSHTLMQLCQVTFPFNVTPSCFSVTDWFVGLC